MSNLDLTISDIFYGDTAVLKIMKGDEQKWPYVQTLPYDAQVEYLQSDGSAFIDTGIKVANTVKFDLSLNLATATKTFVLGGRVAANNKQIGVIIGNNNTKLNWRWGNNIKEENMTLAAGNYTVSNMAASNTVVVNNTSVTLASATFSCNYNLTLYGQNSAGSQLDIPTDMRLKTAKIYSSGTLVRDFIPVRKNGIGYLYDQVSETLFGNAAASGAFTFGNDV